MTAKHTPGPWAILPRAVGGYEVQGTDADGEGSFVEVVATCHREANAQLIATAPDLLAALKMAAHCLQWHVANHPTGMDAKALADAKAAIAKATGGAA